MSVKVSLSEEVSKDESFPKLMIAKLGGTVVLFNSHCEGTVVSGKEYESIGHYSIRWNIESFKDYDGDVTLKN
jgi:hypothetical protein